jgi:hypothetical protein
MTIRATVLLCDWAEEINGKLYIMGGGWTVLTVSEPQATMALAVKLFVPWNRANERIRISAFLLTEDDTPVVQGEAETPVRIDGEFEVGRPAGIPPGTDIDAAFALRFQGLELSHGAYKWVLIAGTETIATYSFLVRTR